MAFPWVAVAMGALSIGASLFQSSSQNAAASASKSAAKKTARDQFIRAQLEFDIANQQELDQLRLGRSTDRSSEIPRRATEV